MEKRKFCNEALVFSFTEGELFIVKHASCKLYWGTSSHYVLTLTQAFREVGTRHRGRDPNYHHQIDQTVNVRASGYVNEGTSRGTGIYLRTEMCVSRAREGTTARMSECVMRVHWAVRCAARTD